jgi:porphobilinogen synthase
VGGRDAGRGRLRRLRRTGALRDWVAESDLPGRRLVLPLFVEAGRSGSHPIPSMPGVVRSSPDVAAERAVEAIDAGVGAVLFFGLPRRKDAAGSEAYSPAGPVPRAIRAVKAERPEAVVITDVCLCAYTDHGHCGVLRAGAVDNDATLLRLARMARVHAEAGADVVAPSAMMDHQVAALRAELDRAGRPETAILGYSAKYASAFYGPFREAAGSAPRAGDRRGYQMDPRNGREALREIAEDVAEGADLVMVKPALPALDVIARARLRFDAPLAAYQVSGEYAMIEAAAARGWLDRAAAATEALRSIRRAGADLIITYYAHAYATGQWGPR